jgi:hypothetical protein
MTRKDYIAISDAINAAVLRTLNATKEESPERHAALMAIGRVQGEISIRLRNDNARFQPGRFQEACFRDTAIPA